MSGPRGATAPTPGSRGAAALSLVLGLVLLLGLPVLGGAAFYVGVLAAALASVALAGGAVLWSCDTLVVRAGVAMAAAPVLVGEVLAISLGLPGAPELAELGPVEALAVLCLAGAILLLLLADALRRSPEQTPDRPYAL